MFTGQSSDTRRLVVAISLSGSAVSFSLTAEESKTHTHTRVSENQTTGVLLTNVLSFSFQTATPLLLVSNQGHK